MRPVTPAAAKTMEVMTTGVRQFESVVGAAVGIRTCVDGPGVGVTVRFPAVGVSSVGARVSSMGARVGPTVGVEVISSPLAHVHTPAGLTVHV